MPPECAERKWLRVEDKYTVKSLVKATHVLECFSVDKPELGISEIARMLHIQKTTVFNILATFESCGYVTQNPKTGKYHLGLKVLHLGYIVNCHMGLRDIFLPYLKRIADITQELCYFGILDQQEVLYIEVAYPSNNQHTRNILGERAPLYCTGLGKAMLAYIPDDERERVLSQELKKYTEHTIREPAKLREHLREIQARGYAVDDMEHEYGIRCVAVPVFGANGRVLAATSISGPSMRFDQDTILKNAQIIRAILAPLQHNL